MRKVLAFAVLALALPIVGLANEVSPAPCVQGSFADYVALSSGCTVGDKVFTDFSYSASGNYALDAGQVTVTPDNSDPLNPGLLFTGSWYSSAGNMSDSHLQFTVSTLSGQALIEDASLSITGYTHGGDGNILVGENLCLGGLFSSQTSDCSSGVTADLGVNLAQGMTYDHTTFTPVSTVDVIKDIGLVSFGNETNFVFTSGLSNHFSRVPVPEPATLTLLGTGLLAIGEKVRRMLRKS